MLLSMDEFRAFRPSKPTYALFGWPLGHTMSPELHAALFAASGQDADYIGVAVPPEDLPEAFALAKEKLRGVNCTIPYKKAVIELLDEVDAAARDLHSVNTVAFRDGRAVGYNTDILGFSASLARDGVTLAGKKVLLLGYGGAASVMAYHCVREGAALTITGRNLEKAAALQKQLCGAVPGARVSVFSRKHIPRDVQIVLNSTPVGMYPKENTAPLHFLPHKTEYVFDAIYNPPVTATMKLANPKKAKTRDGLFMLVMQAAHAQTIWSGVRFEPAACETILRRLYGKMAVKRLHEKHGKQNIVLCGFMGSGKTTIGRKLARLTGLEFIDADQYLETQEGKKISDIFAEQGEPYFRDLETKYLRGLAQRDGIVLSLGGGAVLRQQNVDAVKQTGLLIHLDTPYYRILKNLSYSNTRPLLDKPDRQAETRRLYNARKAVYHRVSDVSVRSPKISEVLEKVVKSI
ncbi:MAG: shikimate kinase [Eubacteriales bacterium]|nr:shikimate kinase [Eubacteriales bacterium]